VLLRSFAAHPFRFRMVLLLFAWVVVFSLSSADLFDLQDEVGRSETSDFKRNAWIASRDSGMRARR